MLRFSAALCACALLLGRTGWAQDKDDKKGPGDEKPIRNPILPLKPGAKWLYRVGEGRVEVQCEKRLDRIFMKNAKGAPMEVDLYHMFSTRADKKDPKLAKAVGLAEEIGISEEGIYRFKAAGKAIQPPMPLFLVIPSMGPLDSWKVDSVSEEAPLKGDFINELKDISISVEKEGKKFNITKAYRVTSKDFFIGPQGLPSKDLKVDLGGLAKKDAKFSPIPMELETWFAPEFGIIKQRSKIGAGEPTEMVLEKFEPGK